MKKLRCCHVTWSIILLVLATASLILGLLGHFKKNEIAGTLVRKLLVLSPDSDTYRIWIDPPVEIQISLWIFNITNPKDVMAGGKPQVQQIGPYVYRQRTVKSNVTFSPSGDLVNYSSHGYYHFDPRQSNGSEDDLFVGLNFPLLAMASTLEYTVTPGLQKALNWILWLYNERAFKTYTVRQFLWGYTDTFFQHSKTLLPTFNMKKEAEIIPDEVGIFTGPHSNGSLVGHWSVFTGVNDPMLFNTISTWNNQSILSCWEDPDVNVINGSDGAMWHALLKKDEAVYMFVPPIYRSLKFLFNGSTHHHGLHLNHYTLSPQVFGTTPTCSECLPYGLLNISACASAPILLSKPHFLHGDPKLQQSIDGLQPTEEYESMIDIHPSSGAGIYTETKLQFNMLLRPYRVFDEIKSVSPTVFPILWMNVSAEVTDQHLLTLCSKMDSLLRMVHHSPVTFFTSSAVFIILICFMLTVYNKHKFYDYLCGHNHGKGQSKYEQSTTDHQETMKPLTDQSENMTVVMSLTDQSDNMTVMRSLTGQSCDKEINSLTDHSDDKDHVIIN